MSYSQTADFRFYVFIYRNNCLRLSVCAGLCIGDGGPGRSSLRGTGYLHKNVSLSDAIYNRYMRKYSVCKSYRS